jgi:RNA polymerase sigma factor (sigma-70 family)
MGASKRSFGCVFAYNRPWHRGGEGFGLGQAQLVQVESAVWVANGVGQHAITPGPAVPTPRATATGWTTSWPSSNGWIKTARCEDNEIEATVAARYESMPTSPLSVVLQHLLADLGPDGGGLTDGELLARFLSSRDEGALAALVRRHARMVWGTCRRLLHNHQDAEDAFQATFLVLVRKAADVPRKAVANWLYGVARQTVVRLRAITAKRGRRETQVVDMPEPTVEEARDADWQSVLDEELSRLPAHYRVVLLLCDLEGMTRREAARQLGMPEGSVASRLARARALLAKRLTQRGVVLSGGSVAAALSAGSASAPPALVASTIRDASLFAAGQAAATSVISAKVAALTEGVVKATFVTRLKCVLAVVLVVAALAGAAGLVYQTQAAEQPQVKEAQPASRKDRKSEKKQPMTKEEKLRVLIDKVLAAHGGEDKLNKPQFTMTVKHSNGETQHYFVQPPKNFRWETQYSPPRDAATRRVCILFPNGRQWWWKNPNGAAVPFFYTGLELPMVYWLDHVKFFGPRRVLRLKDAGHKAALLDEEAKIGDRAAVGVEVTGAWFKAKMYFDKETHLLAKQEGGAYYSPIYFSDYKKFDGIPVAQKEKDGYFNGVVTDFRAVDKLDAKLFERP